ncbi:MAG: primase-helicase family protein, partial [Chlamydiia bacterium]
TTLPLDPEAWNRPPSIGIGGFAVEPRPGDCGAFWEHVQEVICAGHPEHYQYVRKWMACVVQKPRLLATALVLRGLQGTGKNRFVEHFGSLFGPYFMTVNSLNHIAGKFNNHLKYAYLIHANEATWSGSRKDAGVLKALITDPIILLEGKGQDAIQVDNCRHLIISSNEDVPVPMDLDDRRFFALNVSPHRKEDLPYFRKLEARMASDGKNALLFDLLHEDLCSFDPRTMPVNDHGFDIKLRGADSCEKYLFEALCEGRFNLATERSGSWESLPCEFLYQHYKDWCTREGMRYEPSSELGKVLVRILRVEKARPSCGGIRVWWYRLPSLEHSRKLFEAHCKQSSGIWLANG